MVDRVINIRIDPSGAIVGSKQINRALETTGQKIKGVDSGFRQLTAGLRVFAGALALNEVRQFADTSILLGNRLRLVTDSVAELNAVQSELFELSQQTRTSFEGSVELFARVARSTAQLGISQRDVINTTRAVNQAVQISGATAQEASNAIIQFSQGLASGALRGEELRSVLEQVPRLAIALADGLNLSAEAMEKIEGAAPEERVTVTIGLLRELGAEGELTTARIIDALKRVGPELQEEFDQLNVTSDQALVKLRNSFLIFVGDLDKELEFSGGIVGAIDLLRDFVDEGRRRIPEFSDAVEILATEFDSLGDGLVAAKKLTLELATGISNFFDDGEEDVGDFVKRIENDYPLAMKQLEFASEDTVGFIIDSFAGLAGNIESVFRIATVEIGLGFTIMRNQLNKEALEAEGFFGTVGRAGQDLLGLLGGEDTETFLARLEGEAQAASAALERFRQDEINRLLDQAERRRQIRAENQAERDKADREEIEALAKLDEAREKTETASFDPKAQKDADKLLEKLREQTIELTEQNVHGEAAEQIGRQRLINELEQANASTGTLNALRAITTELALQEAIEEELKNASDDAEAIQNLELELALLEAEGDARFRILALQELSVDATDEQLAKVAMLVEAIENAEEAQKNQLITLEEIDREFARGVGDAVGDFLEDVDQGFDGLRDSFANLLSDLAIEILKNIIVTQFFESFLGFGSAGGGIFSRIFGGAPGAAEGLGVSRGEPVMVGEKGQPEIFIPTQQGNVVPFTKVPDQERTVIVNEQDPAGLLATMNTSGGLKVQRNFVTTNSRQVKRTLGVR